MVGGNAEGPLASLGLTGSWDPASGPARWPAQGQAQGPPAPPPRPARGPDSSPPHKNLLEERQLFLLPISLMRKSRLRVATELAHGDPCSPVGVTRKSLKPSPFSLGPACPAPRGAGGAASREGPTLPQPSRGGREGTKASRVHAFQVTGEGGPAWARLPQKDFQVGLGLDPRWGGRRSPAATPEDRGPPPKPGHSRLHPGLV